MSKGLYGRRDRLIKEKHHDTYYERRKWPSPTLCTECDALYMNGRWTWQQVTSSAELTEAICPACRRIIDNYPAGYIEIEGAFYHDHQQDILNLIYNVADQEKAEHPLERIIRINKTKDHMLITTTGIHLARRIGEAMSRAFKGELAVRYADDEHNIRINWVR